MSGVDEPIVGIVGCGVTGSRVADLLGTAGLRLALFDLQPDAAARVAAHARGVVVESVDDLAVADTVVLCQPAPHERLAARLLRAGVSVVSICDDLDDVTQLLSLGELAQQGGAALVAGAAMSPGFTGLLAASVAEQVPVLEELHIAVHGTGGPACARQHHRALGDTSRSWHDGQWLERIGGSGRELCWFPEPIGARDCYRAALADPLVLHRAFPMAQRVSARVSGTRRDRLTARLPMLTPPHREGDLGAVRVEARGSDTSGSRITSILGASGYAAHIAAATAAAVVLECHGTPPPAGLHVLGGPAIDAGHVLRRVVGFGVHVQEFTGVPSHSRW
jgi:hypothetical protein